MAVEIKNDIEARDGLKNGVDKLANAVKATLGPKGRNVIMTKAFGEIVVTKDGVSVAKEINLKDAHENMGAQLVKEVASKTNELAGDGTTTATVLAQALIKEGLKNVAAGANPMDLKKGIDKAVIAIVENLGTQTILVDNSVEKIEQIATISANNDEVIGKLISESFQKVGNTGIVTVEESKTSETYIEVSEGMQFDRGFMAPHFVTNAEKMIAEYDNANILVTDRKITDFRELVPILETAINAGKPFLIIAEDINSDILSGLVVNKIKGGLNICAVKAPGFGERKKQMLEDICILTGATLVSDDNGLPLDAVTLAHLGSCDKTKITKDNTLLLGGSGKKEAIESRVTHLQGLLAESKNDYDRNKVRERIAKLTSGIAVLYVGAASEVEMKEKKDRVEDALHATRAALVEGIVPGGGVALLRAKVALEGMTSDNPDIATGIKIVMKAIESPLRTIAENAGVEGSVVVDKVLNGNKDFGYNAKTGEYVNMIKAGIIDPKKVTRVALENAASVAGMIITTEVALVALEEEKVDNIDLH